MSLKQVAFFPRYLWQSLQYAKCESWPIRTCTLWTDSRWFTISLLLLKCLLQLSQNVMMPVGSGISCLKSKIALNASLLVGLWESLFWMMERCQHLGVRIWVFCRRVRFSKTTYEFVLYFRLQIFSGPWTDRFVRLPFIAIQTSRKSGYISSVSFIILLSFLPIKRS